MKKKPPVYHYESVFAKDMYDYLRFRASQGYQCCAEPYIFKTLDAYLCRLTSSDAPITAELVDEWIQSITARQNTKTGYISSFRQFAKYLRSLGYTVYMPDPPRCAKAYVPHIFTQDELRRLFAASDNLNAKYGATYAPIQIPVLLRILYGCGLRVGETLALQNKDIDWLEKTLLLRNTKGHKDRLVPMSDSVADVCRAYYDLFHPSKNQEDYFFHNKLNQEYPLVWAFVWMKRTLEAAGIDPLQETQNSRAIGLHCLRHTFAVHSLDRQNDRGIDRYYSVPILSTYLGHEDIYGTETYLRLTSERHTKIVSDMSACSERIFSEVQL